MTLRIISICQFPQIPPTMNHIHKGLSENHITASIREIIRITKTHDVTERHVQKVVLGQCEEFEWHSIGH